MDVKELCFFEKRSGVDRRNINGFWINKIRFYRKRSYVRRKEDRLKSYDIDKHSFKTVLSIFLVILLSITDAILTLILLGAGASEINPVMAYFLNQGGPVAFFVAKYILTCSAILLVMMHANKFIFNTNLRAKYLIRVFAVSFFLVINWELYLIFFIS